MSHFVSSTGHGFLMLWSQLFGRGIKLGTYKCPVCYVSFEQRRRLLLANTLWARFVEQPWRPYLDL